MPPSQRQIPALQTLGFYTLILFLFLSYSRVFDIKFSFLHIPGISLRFMAVVVVVSGACFAALRDRIGKCMLGFTACFLASIPFSVWIGGSVETLTAQWILAFVAFIAVAALIPDFAHYVRIARTLAYGTLVLSGICLVFGSMESGRLFLENGRFANPNEMAQALLLGMPFWWAMYTLSRSLFGKFAAAGALALMLYVLSKTGSRGAMISLFVIILFMFFQASLAGKAKLLLSAVLMVVLAATILPASLRSRYLTLFNADDEQPASAADQRMLESATDSAEGRKQMLIESLILTGRHPLLGVGPGMFPVAENDLARAQGRKKGDWIGTHNSFTEVSSECGIPAFLFYASMVVLSFRRTYSLYRSARHRSGCSDVAIHAKALNYAIIAFVVTGFFVHTAYSILFPVLAGLAVSLQRTAFPLVTTEPAPAAETGQQPASSWARPGALPRTLAKV